ncbi:MAG: cobalamin-independent methionine synthase II family protein [Hyphomicrobiaceae bacterium]|nr:cobalamin-independent methionine synthase II family protein [Hyphomicrobiaceae bacterium]
MQRSTNRILTTHAGSLPRPEALTALYVARVRGEAVDESVLAKAGADAVPWVVKAQLDAGMDIISNGEQQRESFVLYLRRRLSGLGGVGSRVASSDMDAYPKYKEAMARQVAVRPSVSNRDQLPKCVGPIGYIGQADLKEEIESFRTALAAVAGRYAEAFFTAASPGILAAIVRNEHYASQADYIGAVAEALRTEYEAIVAAGFLLQIDAPDLALERHTSFRDRPLAEFQAFVETVVAAINRALANVPRDRVRLHVCWGNYEGPHDRDVPLADIWPILQKANVGGFFLPFANPRHAHEVKVFERMPPAPDQVLTVGVIDTLTNFVEHPEVVADRIERVARIVGDPTRIIAGTDCGFDTSAGMGRVAEDVVWAKLRAMRNGADIASQRLFA